ncbi:ATP-binding cassette domain-containing protein [Flavobacterium amnicola]|uniref:ATP-binding cassette domain-containing protein n=1 Tax=Flavobacterium amnicola TaxID=2506422 RepID=A0A4Q1K1M9_9FLAO|nr:ATP-binding cassette domain-containing protein [Flavobacterium amnicola]RXR17846.1 ATP-binding cassette domain-containing protein [Flavobacterium amnicola]
MIATKNISFAYGNENQFQFPDIVCNASESLLITGNSGVGKTTLLHLLGGLLRPISGEINLDNVAIQTLSDKKLDAFRGKNIGIVLQQNHFVEALSVLENVMLASWLATGKKDKAKAKSLLEHLHLEKHWDKLPSQLSVGQQQRVSIARALINNPKVLLADEPTSSLDDANTLKVANLLENLAKEYDTALIIVTHDSRLKERFSNQISLL